MCRLFGFRSVIPSQVHRSLLAAENALGVQSNSHPDGWGVAFYVDGAPHVTRSPTTALGDALFHRLSGVVSSETVLAHVRKATQGNRTIFNCHPFQFGRWVFAHNGDIPNFETKRELLLAQVSPRFQRFILGETDSEVLFFVFMTVLEAQGSLTGDNDIDSISNALREAVNRARALCDFDGTRSLLTVVATNGDCLVAAHGGKELYFSTYKTRCSDRGTCPSLSASCESPSSGGPVNHFIVSSEPLQGENVWVPLAAGDVIGVDARMLVRRSRLDHVALPVVA
jgi:predicted glutamine amidotransferase